MTAPAPRGTDPRVEALVAYLCGHDFENVGEDHARQYAWFEIRELEAAGLIVALPDDATVERVAKVISGIADWRDNDRIATVTARAVLAALAGGAL